MIGNQKSTRKSRLALNGMARARSAVLMGALAAVTVGGGIVLGAQAASAIIPTGPGPVTQYLVQTDVSAQAGDAFSTTVYALNVDSQIVASDDGSIHVSTTDPTDPAFSETLSGGQVTFDTTMDTTGLQTLTVTDNENDFPAQTSITILPGAATHLAVTAPATANDGSQFEFSVDALDQFGNLDTNYDAPVTFSSSDALSLLPTSGNLVDGAGNFPGRLGTTGLQWIAASSNGLSGTSNFINVFGMRITGYDLVGADGGAFAIGGEAYYGGMAGQKLNAPIVGIATTPDALGYWEVAADGGVFAFGDASYYGSMAGHRLNAPMIGIGSTPDGKGYWEAAADGGVFAFGDATFVGSHGAIPIRFNKPVVGMAVTPDGLGYWLVAADGGVFSYGDAKYFGSMGDQVINSPIVGMARTYDGNGYWLVASDGGVFTFGDAGWAQSLPGLHIKVNNAIGIAGTADGAGYWVAQSNGTVTALGDAASEIGSVTGPTDIVGISAGPSTYDQDY